jgi:cullin-associated NEDD8-dissociated protein 1
MRELNEDGDIAVLANTGPLLEPIIYDDYTSPGRGGKRYPPGVFSHNTQSQEVWTVKAGYQAREAKGVLGRIANSLRDLPDPYKTALFTMDGYAPMLEAGVLSPEVIDPNNGVVRFTEYSVLAADIAALHGHESRSLFSDTFSSVLQSSLVSTEGLGVSLENVTLESGRVFPNNRLGPQLEEVSKLLHLHKTEVSRTERAAFYTSIGGFDTHGTMEISELMARLNDGLAAFTDELKEQGLWNNVTVVVASEFGRTLSSNSQGSDHGWGGNYFVLGGDVKGRQMLGKYPSRLTEFVSEANIGRGRMIPSTPWESVWNGVGEWLGLDAEARLELLPNMANFPTDAMFSHSQLFKTSAPATSEPTPTPTLSPTPTPTPAPITREPSPAPTNYCPAGYDDIGVRWEWGLGRVVVTTTHDVCSARCTEYSAAIWNGGCKGYMTGMYAGMLFCRSYGGNVRTRPCAPWARPSHPGQFSGALGSIHPRTNFVNIGGHCCQNMSFVPAGR